MSTSMIVYISDHSLLKVIEVGTLKALSRFLNLSRSFIASRVIISPLNVFSIILLSLGNRDLSYGAPSES